LALGENMDPYTFVEHEYQLIKEKSSAFIDDEKILASAMKDLAMQR
jgi:hypothetical protein